MIQFSKDYSLISAGLLKNKVSHEIKVQIHPKGKKVYCDGKKVDYTSEFIRNYFSIITSPDLISHFKLFPSVRRYYFDRFFSLISKEYWMKISEYHKTRK